MVWLSGPADDERDALVARAAALQSVRDRVEAFDGQLTVEPGEPGSPRSGTVRLQLPLPLPSSVTPAGTGSARVTP